MSRPGESTDIECTLDRDRLGDRVLEWSDLEQQATATVPVRGGVLVTFPGPLAGAVEDLARRERECCGTWLRIVTERAEGLVRVWLTADRPEGVATIRSLAGLTAPDRLS